jgi:hypothetical protein
MNRLYMAVAILVFVGIVYSPEVNASDIQTCAQKSLVSTLNSKDAIVIPSGWKQYFSIEGNFSILIPNEPVIYDITDNSLFTLNRSTVVTDNSAFIFDYIDFHVDISKTSPSELMDTYISGFLGADEKAKVRDVTVDTYSGKEFEYQVQGVNAISRIFLVGQRLYILIVINPESDSYETFVNSFKLMP